MFKKAIIFIINCYRLAISPFLPSCCRFYPSCSQYAIDAVKKYGAARGISKACMRIIKCNPFHPGGFDPA